MNSKLDRFQMVKGMNLIITQLNNEDAYYEWINLVPDEAHDDELFEVAEDDDLFYDSIKLFKILFCRYANGGIYIDKKLL